MKKFRSCTPAAGVALAAGTAKTAHQLLAAANDEVWVDWIEISFDGVSPTAVPGEVVIERQTTAPGTPGTAPTIVEIPFGAPLTLQTTAATGGGTEPTGSDDYYRGFLHPQGRHIIPGPFPIMGGDRLGVVLNFAAVVNVHVTTEGRE